MMEAQPIAVRPRKVPNSIRCDNVQDRGIQEMSSRKTRKRSWIFRAILSELRANLFSKDALQNGGDDAKRSCAHPRYGYLGGDFEESSEQSP